MNNEDVDKLKTALRAVVEQAIERELTPNQIEHAVLWWEPYSDCGSTSKTSFHTRTDYRVLVRMLHGAPEIDNLLSVSNEIRRIKWPEFVVDPTVEDLCEGYFSAARSVSLDEDLLQQTAEEYVRDVQAEEFVYVTVLQVSGFSADAAFELSDEIKFRPVTQDDIRHYGYEPLPVRDRPRLNTRDWMCVIRQTYKADDYTAHHRSRDIWEPLIGALGLVCEGSTSFSLLSEGPASPYLSSTHFGSTHQIRSSPHGNAIHLDSDGIDHYQEMFRLVKPVCDGNTKHLAPAFRRFRAAAGREIMDDKLTDLVIALESLLVPDGRKGEIRYKFGMRGGALLPERHGGPRERRKLMQKLYDARSQVVHESKGTAQSEVTWLINRATDGFRTIFKTLAQSPVGVEKSIFALDDAMVDGGNPTAAHIDLHRN